MNAIDRLRKMLDEANIPYESYCEIYEDRFKDYNNLKHIIDCEAGFNEKTSEIVLIPKYVGEIIKCKDCKYFDKKGIVYTFDGTK